MKSRKRYGVKRYRLSSQRLHGVPLVKAKGPEVRIWVEYKVHDLPEWRVEPCRTVAIALSVAQGMIDNFAQARIVWEHP